jgi:hypothetical protein
MRGHRPRRSTRRIGVWLVVAGIPTFVLGYAGAILAYSSTGPVGHALSPSIGAVMQTLSASIGYVGAAAAVVGISWLLAAFVTNRIRRASMAEAGAAAQSPGTAPHQTERTNRYTFSPPLDPYQCNYPGCHNPGVDSCASCGRLFCRPHGSGGVCYVCLPPVNPTATLALVCALLGLVCLPVAVLAIPFGHSARNQIRRNQGRERGAGRALSGLILGYIFLIVIIALIVHALSDALSH